MVRLENIKSNGVTISCDYFPEDRSEKGFLEVNSSGEIVSIELSDYDKKQVYASFAKRKLVEIISSGKEIPSKSGVAWY